MLDERSSLSHRPRLTARAWALALAWSCACSVYTEDMLRPGVGGSGGSGAGGAPSAGAAGREVGGSAPQAGSESVGGGAAGAPDVPGGAGSAAAGTAPVGGDGGEGGVGGGAADDCPEDPAKLEPGACGCGVPESCVELEQALLHRYSFDAAGTMAVDSVGDADGTIVGATAADGQVTFDGTTASYVDLPNGLVSSLTNASFEIWLSWAGGSSWQRIFDFGSNDKAEGQQGAGQTYLYLTPREGTGSNALRASYTRNGINSETIVRASAPLPMGTPQHIVLVVDDTNNQLRLYLNGELSALTGFQGTLADINDVNNWVGRSNYVDPPLGGTIVEVRIYGAALTNAQVMASSAFGPDPEFLNGSR